MKRKYNPLSGTKPLNALRGIKARFNGAAAEFRARRFLTAQGLSFIEQNYLCKWGEIDLIFSDAEQLVFVEVKSRVSADYGSADEFYSKAKQQKLTRAIMTYLAEKGFNPEMTHFRIDVIAITEGDLQWYKSV